MKQLFSILFLLLLSSALMQSALTRPPEDFMGRISVPSGTEAEVLKFKTNQIVYAGTNGSGLYVSYDAGSNWKKLTGFPEKFPCIKDIIITPNNEIYVATFGGGIYFSNDDGGSFTAKNKGITNLFTQSIAITNDGILVCGTYGSGIFYSIDKGANWVRTDVGLRYDNINSIQVMNNGYIVAGSYGGGFYVSRDTCKTWLLSNTALNNIFINDLVKDITGKLYAATNGDGVMYTPDGIQWLSFGKKKHDFGDQFNEPLLDTAVTAVGVNSYQKLMGTRSAGMYYWDDVWNAWTTTGPLAVGITACTVAPNGTILATRTFGDVIRSTDNGMKWNICADKIVSMDLEKYNDSPTFLNVFVSKFDNSLISVADKGTTQQLSYSEDHGNTWKYLNSITTTKVFDVEKTPDGTIFVADEDGIHRYLPSKGTFELVCTIPEENPGIWRFREIDYNQQTNTVFGTYELFIPAIPPPPPPAPGWVRLEYRLYKSVNNGNSWNFKNYGEVFLNNLNCELDGDIYLKIMDDYSKSTDNGIVFNTLEVINKPIIEGKEGNLYYFSDDRKEIYVQKNKTGEWSNIPFSPEIYVEDGSWEIQCLGSNLFGDLYVSIRINTPNQGLMYELYMTHDYGKNWHIMRGCYNMDKIRYIRTDDNGYAYLLTNALYKILSPNRLKAPIITAPTNENIGEERNPIFAWKRVPLAEEYELQIDQNDTFFAPFETNVTGDTTCTAVIDLKYNTQYAWRIRSKTHSARSAWRIGYFTVGLEPPVLISPENGKAGVPIYANLKWHKIQDATHYFIEVAEDGNFEKIVYSSENHPDTSIITDKLFGLKTYYWRVKAFTETNTSSWSEVWNFRTVMGPPQLIYPENHSIDRLVSEQFKWHKSEEATTYYIQVAKDSAFTDLFFEGSADADTFKIIDNMLAETDYYWHVSSVNAQGTSEYSDIWTFRTSLKSVELTLPGNGKVNLPLDTKLTWLEHNSGNQYQIQISKEADFKTTVIDEKVNNILEFQTNKLEYYKNYFWRVRLVVGQRFGFWSEIWSFKTGIQSASLLNPPYKSKDEPTTLKFKWYEVFGAKFYQLQISKNDQFTDMVYSMDSLTKAEQYIEDLEPEILYYWRVRAWNDESYGTAQWSNVWTFTTGKVTLVLRNPKSGSTGVDIPVLLTWFPATTAEYYHLQVASDAEYANIVFDQDSINDTKWMLAKTDVAVSTDYYWRVKGVSTQYTTPWSETWHFTTSSTSVEESALLNSIKLFPNPTGNKVELSINYAETCDAKILICTADGKIIRTDVIRLLLGETRYEIDAEKLTSGTYYITIITPSGYITRELVVMK